MLINAQWARKLKKSWPKKLVKSNKSISRENFLAKFHFLQFQKWPKINFWTVKKFKNTISRKKNWFIWFYEFFCLDFFKFSGLLGSVLNFCFDMVTIEFQNLIMWHRNLTCAHVLHTFPYLWLLLLLSNQRPFANGPKVM